MKMRLRLALLALLPSAAVAQDRVSLWPDGAPGSEEMRDVPETSGDWWVRDVHDPSVTVFAPDGARSGTAVIVVPGGGHANLVFNSEGVAPAKWLAARGVTAFALKYRLARQEGSPYDIETDAAADLRRAVRFVRAHAEEYGVSPDRIGVLGFSAGGELVNLVTYGPAGGDAEAADLVERQSARPDFQVQIYPGPIGLPDHFDQAPPPAFFLAAFEDKGPTLTLMRQLDLYREAGVPAELHVFAHGAHAFNMGDRSDFATVSDWPERLADWMIDSGFMDNGRSR
ncbi:alpha/beta hydrolase [Parvularcula dongshanensis]|uniref:Acetyl esterase/lipase n=1 Tax=Parvularcula dongshanensis TaxID=1173995 RepID=A0A840I0J5_9PROT|nr:alpha/beta hydrolase [Parvularcula dongshanensis]MBB4658586.1 acetyl esterase/lipase [Parvularcula dongshanensis]